MQLSFTSRPLSVAGAFADMMARFPVRLSLDPLGQANLIPMEFAFDSSRLYRSASEPIKISAVRDVIAGSLRVTQRSLGEIRNNAIVNYGMSPDAAHPINSYTYQNWNSFEWFGKTPPILSTEPALPASLDGTDGAGAVRLARIIASQGARPVMRVELALRQSFYDLHPGHIIDWDTDFELMNWRCPGWLCGLPECQFPYSGAGSNYARGTPPLLVLNGGDALYLGFGQQVGSWTLNVGTPAVYTTIGAGDGSTAWERYNGRTGIWTTCTNVTNGNAPKSSGAQVVTHTRPGIEQWPKGFLIFSGLERGPCYWVRMKYGAVSNGGTGSSWTTCPAIWGGRISECIESTWQEPGNENGVPVVRAVFEEIM